MRHAKLLIYSFLTWGLFVLIGWPEYYQQWWDWAKVVLVALVTLLYFPVSRITLEKMWSDGRHDRNAWMLAFYLTVPLFAYDYVYLGIYKDLGIGFVVPYWYLTFFYFSFWVQIPWVGRRMMADAKPATA